MPAKRAETSLRSFLEEATLAYSEDEYQERMLEEGLVRGEYTSGGYIVEDTYRVSPDMRVFSGREEVYRQSDYWAASQPIWVASYHGAVMPRIKPDPILRTYKEILKNPLAELPIRGPRSIKIGDYEYSLGSTRGPMSIARFAVIEEMTKKGRRVYRGDISGGWNQ